MGVAGRNSMKPIVAAIIAAALLAPRVAPAQDKPDKPAEPTPAATPADEPYQPGLGEIMALQQMRHIKLWFAGNAANWPLADYEIGELGEGFDDVRKLLGSDIVDQHIGSPIAALQKAIHGKDRRAFIAAFDNLSAGCNACHHALDHGFIAIQRPNMLPYSNQNFVPQK
jgi:hypothetical protein